MKLSRGLEILIGEQKLNTCRGIPTGTPPIHEPKPELKQESSEKSELIGDRRPREIVVHGGNPCNVKVSYKRPHHRVTDEMFKPRGIA